MSDRALLKSNLVAVTDHVFLDPFPVSETDYVEFCEETRHPVPHYLRARDPRSEYPVVYVSSIEAEEYASWLAKRLPTLAEWQHMAFQNPDGTYSDYPWGSTFAVEWCNCAESGIGQVTPFIRYPGGRTPCGAYDAIGNVWEWLSDTMGLDRLIVGGSWYDHQRYCKHEMQIPWTGSERVQDIGFRCALDA